MEDPNFEFLREMYPLYYRYCMKMDYFIFDGEYDEAALNSRKAVEGMVKNADKHFNPKTFVDYSTTKGKKPFKQHYLDLYDQGYCNDDIMDEIKYIWKKGGDSAHPTFRNFKREDLNLIAEKTHKIIKYFFKEINPLYSISSVYVKITGDEEWIKERKGNSEDIKELNRQIEEKEKDSKYWPVTMPTIPQIRMTRKIRGEYEQSHKEMHTEFSDSVGMVSDWKKRGPVYEVPFSTLYNKCVKNLIVAGRCTSVNETLWDIMRVIPCCAVTGQAAGTAAALTDDFSSIDINVLQKTLVEDGVFLHEKDIK